MPKQKEPLQSLKRFIKACEKAEQEYKEITKGMPQEWQRTAGDILFGCVIQKGKKTKFPNSELTDKFVAMARSTLSNVGEL